MGNIIGKLTSGENFNKTIYELKVGESGYSYPTALEFDYKMNGYLDLEEVSNNKKDKMNFLEMKITRTGVGKDDFDVDISKVEDYCWKKTNYPFEYDIKQLDDPDENILVAKLNYKNIVDYKINKNKEVTLEDLQKKLEEATLNEDYELSAKLRDEIEKRSK